MLNQSTCTSYSLSLKCFNKVSMKKCFLLHVSDFYIESSQNVNLLIDLFNNEAGFVIDHVGKIMSYMSVVVDANCVHMNFAAYPVDRHKCEFFIASISHTEASMLYTVPTILVV